MKKRISLSTKFSFGVAVIIIVMVAILSVATGFFFYQNCLANFNASSETALSEFSDSISMFFSAKEVELNVFSETSSTQEVQNASKEMSSDSRVIMEEIGRLLKTYGRFN